MEHRVSFKGAIISYKALRLRGSTFVICRALSPFMLHGEVVSEPIAFIWRTGAIYSQEGVVKGPHSMGGSHAQLR